MNPPKTRALRVPVGGRAGDVSALLLRPERARWLLLMAHGAGADMRHAFMEAMARRLGERAVASLRYQFPYTERGSRRPDPRATLLATVRAALAVARQAAGDLPLLAGGKSMGGRMTSLAASEEPFPGLRGLVFFGFPLHPSGRAGRERGEHLSRVDRPMLFLQGTRDKLAELEQLRPVCRGLGDRATLRVVEGADHSFHVLKRSGRSDSKVMEELADAVHDWAAQLL